ncbi:IclR family transcriptional regulator [Streptomyces sp. NPDC096012]|uniref:IclR family transcriptional regulator n=1 Tax=Streptomyces sp. NPDC096012 TaxID=3155684 RepID=UPI00336A14D9
MASALDVLACLESSDELGISELARKLGVAKSTVHRMVSTLCAKGFVERNAETNCYRLGLRLYELGQAAATRSRLRRTALPLLEQLRMRTGHTIHLAVPDGADIIYVERLHSHRGLQLLSDVGHRLPAHVTASGKAIAAFDPEVAEARRAAGFPYWTSCSIRTADRYEAALDEVRRNRFAINDQEAVHGMTTVAAPVLDRTGRARAAISIVAPIREVGCALTAQAGLVTAVARRLAHDLCI